MKLYSNKTTKNKKTIRLLGVLLYKQSIVNGYNNKEFLYGLYKIKTKNEKNKYYLFGIQILSKTKNTKKTLSTQLTNHSYRMIQELIYNAFSISALHSKVFPPFKNIHKGEKIAVLGAGPTLEFFEPSDKYVYVGVNKTFQYDKVKLKYLFMLDYNGVKDYIEDACNYDCIKFYGKYIERQQPRRAWNIPDHIAEKANAHRFYSDSISKFFYKDIEHYPLADYASTIFCAIHFALYTHPKRIYLVGCDCTQSGHFDGKAQTGIMNQTIVKRGYHELKEFVSIFYPDVEIVSINPVGLKGLFRDVYTKSYLAKHPEIDENEVEILTEEVA